jgi:hypothetical protein
MKASTKEGKLQRSLASQPTSFRPYEDNYQELMQLCQQSGRKPAEELRDLVDEGLKVRRQNGGENTVPPKQILIDSAKADEFVELVRHALRTGSEQTEMILALTRHQREQYALLLEIL